MNNAILLRKACTTAKLSISRRRKVYIFLFCKINLEVDAEFQPFNFFSPVTDLNIQVYNNKLLFTSKV